jgi:hypothetical protein
MNKISDYSISDILQAAGIETKKIGNTTVCRCPICHFGETLKSGQHEAQINDNQTVPTLVCHSCGKAYTRTELIERLDLFDVLKIQKWQEKEGSEKMEQAKKVLEFKTKKQEPEAEKPQRNYADEWKILKPLTKIEKQYLAGRGILDIDIEQVKITNPGYLAFAYHNSNGDVVGYSVRGIYADPETGKKPNYKLIPKNTTIAFNFSNALIKSELADVYIVEGEIDALSMLKMGYNAIAAGGATFLKPELAEIIKNAGKNPIFCADNDEAGRQAIERLPENCNYIFWICDKDTAKDPNDVLVRGLNFSDITEIKKTEPKPLLESQTLKFLVSSIKNKIIDAEDKKNILIQFSKWFEKWQFADTTSPVFCGLDIHSEQIIIFEKSTQKTLYLEKISSLQSLLGIDQGLTLKDAALPPCRIEFNPENSKTIEFSKGLEKFKINTFKKSETRLKAENYATEIQLKSGKLEYNILETTLQSEAPAVWAIISNLFIKLDERRYFLNWLSYIAQTKKKTRNAVIIKGLQGTGKGLLFEKIIRPFFGNGAENPQDDSQVITLSNESLKSEFNGDLENQLFVAFNEVKPDFRDGTTLYEKLKQIISDDFLIVNQKFIKPRQVKNYANCIFFSNNSIPVSVENSDRRYSIFTANTSLDSLYSKSEISDLVDKIESGECVKFWAILLAYNYSSTEALNVFVNDEKEIIQRTTQEWTTIFSDLLIQKKYDKLYDWLFELISFNGTENNYRIENLKKEIDNKYVSSNTAYSLYLFSLFGLSEDPDPEKINSMKILTRTKFSMKISAGLGKIKVIRINSKILRVWQI